MKILFLHYNCFLNLLDYKLIKGSTFKLCAFAQNLNFKIKLLKILFQYFFKTNRFQSGFKIISCIINCR